MSTPTPSTTAGIPSPALSARPSYSPSDIEYKLRSIDAGTGIAPDDESIPAYAAALDSLEQRCTDSRAALGDLAVRAQELAHSRAGQQVTLLELLDGMDGAIPAAAPQAPCSDYFAAWLSMIATD